MRSGWPLILLRSAATLTDRRCLAFHEAERLGDSVKVYLAVLELVWRVGIGGKRRLSFTLVLLLCLSFKCDLRNEVLFGSAASVDHLRALLYYIWVHVLMDLQLSRSGLV